ncbi:hypothetical protein HPP92_006897 [Vanilla planifolia]|uniref:Cotton fiber protein n=1 Tax=Vanilla planifolia TaxID=51239 RepID=A0A835RFB6_VANPL|nr:hypothetical protein HPP92_006897 [Vanilla planifolia]
MVEHKNKTMVAGRAWRLIRLALLWARKGGAFKPRVFLDLRLFLSQLKNLLPVNAGDGGRSHLHYHEREFSFDDTPVFHFKTHRSSSLRLPRIPCITPSFSFEDDDEILLERLKLSKADATRECEHNGFDDKEEGSDSEASGAVEEEEEGIDSRAERFIMEFYERMTAQRDRACLEYSEMLRR